LKFVIYWPTLGQSVYYSFIENNTVLKIFVEVSIRTFQLIIAENSSINTMGVLISI
jgi:hypothetical protein